jgi:hypothetical protein
LYLIWGCVLIPDLTGDTPNPYAFVPVYSDEAWGCYPIPIGPGGDINAIDAASAFTLDPAGFRAWIGKSAPESTGGEGAIIGPGWGCYPHLRRPAGWRAFSLSRVIARAVIGGAALTQPLTGAQGIGHVTAVVVRGVCARCWSCGLGFSGCAI